MPPGRAAPGALVPHPHAAVGQPPPLRARPFSALLVCPIAPVTGAPPMPSRVAPQPRALSRCPHPLPANTGRRLAHWRPFQGAAGRPSPTPAQAGSTPLNPLPSHAPACRHPLDVPVARVWARPRPPSPCWATSLWRSHCARTLSHRADAAEASAPHRHQPRSDDFVPSPQHAPRRCPHRRHFNTELGAFELGAAGRTALSPDTLV